MLYAVGDIHGESEMLAALLAKLPLAPEDRVVFVGDYVDRGPDSKRVVDLLIAFSREHRCEFLLGNHESMFLDFLGWRGSVYFGGDAFLMNGGDRTLASYGFFGERPKVRHDRVERGRVGRQRGRVGGFDGRPKALTFPHAGALHAALPMTGVVTTSLPPSSTTIATPAADVQRKVSVACQRTKTPVTTATTAKR